MVKGIEATSVVFHFVGFSLYNLVNEFSNLHVQGVSFAELQRHCFVELAIPYFVCDIGHHGHGFVLDRVNPLDHRLLVGWGSFFNSGDNTVEPVVLAQDFLDCGFLFLKHCQRCKVHLHGKRVLELARPVYVLVGLIQKPALVVHREDGIKAQHSRDDDQQYDEKEGKK
ncbi:MAG TPA: hypothetical protein VE222_03865 [Nitrospiraceae bacterium]|nr:hypothetical protein [Nitrospiraceae bacterium]